MNNDFSHLGLTGEDKGRTTSVASALANLPELLGAIRACQRTVVAIINFSDHRYVQFWVDRTGYVKAEVISNFNIGDAVALQPHHEDALRALGFHEPTLGPDPNWWIKVDAGAPLGSCLATIARAVTEVLGERGSNSAEIRTFDMNHVADRGRARVYLAS
jgi:hypothetical protein